MRRNTFSFSLPFACVSTFESTGFSPAGYDIETGRSGNDVKISPRMLTEYYLPVFKTCVQVAKVKSIM